MSPGNPTRTAEGGDRADRRVDGALAERRQFPFNTDFPGYFEAGETTVSGMVSGVTGPRTTIVQTDDNGSADHDGTVSAA